jgi:hypothetical protein
MKVMRSNAARPGSGRLVICCWLSVVVTAVCEVCIPSPAAVATTLSATPPGVRTGLMVAGTPAFSRMSPG